ncbi:hypothetical protein EGW08_014581 [Elysia chlorotica]|uniref:Uncharacterized protein n=1 Tax=Elysia chlorotica TaxID=188477 RepID=A0A3S0ZXI2_ELYCH|nr:hypothetical protein EGW08_014581 [Elysia chlorotica]
MESTNCNEDVTLDINRPQQADENEIDSCGAGYGGLDTKRSFSELDSLSEHAGFNDTGDFADDDDLDGKEINGDKQDDPVFNEIRESIARCHSSAKSHTSSSDGSQGSPHVKVANKFMSLPYGLVPWASYEHGKRSVTYNGRMRQFIILDSKGITSWKRDAVEHRVCRDLHYPKYEYRLITNVIYAKKHNCYFVLGKDFSLKVYNRDFYETCSVSADLRSVLFMLFNPVRDELITGGVGGTKVWRFHQQSGITPTMLRPLANYGLTLKYELPSVGGSWVKRVELDHHLEHLYCCSDTDLHVYDLSGKLLFKFERAHMMSITGCRYSQAASVLVTSSIDCEVKVWSLMGGLIHTFRGHSRAVTNLLLHPATSSIVLTCSLDGTVRMWSLDTMDCIYSLVVSTDGLLWMGLTDDNMLFISTARAVTLWHMNYTVQFWALARSRVLGMELCGCKEKTTRLMAISEDSSVRLMARSNQKNLCTVLPPPSISPLQRVLSVCYSREFDTIYMLVNPHEIWVYTTRTDPACRIAVWDVVDVQASFPTSKSNASSGDNFNPSSISVNKPAPSHRATESGAGLEPVANCCCLTILNSTAIVWTDEGCCCPIRDSYLLLGLEDGRILFMDPVKKGHKYLEFKTGKDPVLDMYHDTTHQALVTVYKLPGMMQVHVWGLPDLELQHEVYTTPDLRRHARLGYTLVTAHESGSVMFHSMELATDPGLHKSKMVPVLGEVVDLHHKPQHQAPVIALDVCASLRIFCSCSKDGAIKIWTEDEALLTEIMLDETLTSGCFLNNMGDLVVGFQKQVFFIDHSKVCPQLEIPESDVDTFDKESFICEDPAVMYEGVSPNPDPVTLNNYLVPFDIEFSKDFLEGKVKLEPEALKQEESDDESAQSQAPTETYLSPAPTPRRRLSLVDLTLGSGVTQYELLKYMKKTMDHLVEKEHIDAAQLAFEIKQEVENQEANRLRRRLARMKSSVDGVDAKQAKAAVAPGTDGVEKDGSKEGTKDEPLVNFSFPHFGESPGPTPRSTPDGTPQAMSEAEESEPEDAAQAEDEASAKTTTMQVVKPEDDD